MAEEEYDPRKHGRRQSEVTTGVPTGVGVATAPGMSMSLGEQPYDPTADPRRPTALPAPPGPAQMEGWYREPALAGSYLAKGALGGAGVLGDLQDYLSAHVNRGVFDPIRRAFGATDPVSPIDAGGRPLTYPGAARQSMQQLFPGATPDQLPDYLKANRAELGPVPRAPSYLSSTNLQSLGERAGIVNRPDLQPQGTGEKYLAAGAEGVGGAVPFMGLGPGGAIPNAIRGLSQGLAGGLAGEAAAQATGDNPLARAGGAVAGALGAGGGANLIGKGISAAQGLYSPMVQAYQRLGMTPSLAGNVSDSAAARQLQAYSGTSFGGAGRTMERSNQNLTEFGNAADRAASQLAGPNAVIPGGARTADEAGQALAMHERAWANNFQTGQRNIWDNVDMHLPQTTQAPLTNYANTLTRIQREIPNLTDTARELQDPFSRALLDRLISDSAAGRVATVRDLRGIRTEIGDRLATPTVQGDSSRPELARLWGALSRDIESLIATRGPAAQQAFAEASAYSRNGHQFIDNYLSHITQGTAARPTTLLAAPAAEKAISMASRSGQFAEALRTEIPDAANELAAYKLRQMTLPRAGQAEVAPSSPNRYLTESARDRLTPESRAALFGPVEPVLDDLRTVAGGMRRTEQQFNNASGTAQRSQVGQALTGWIPGFLTATGGTGGGIASGNITGALAGAGTGLGTAAATAALTAGTNRTIAQALTSPRLNRTLTAPTALPATTGSGMQVGGALAPWIRALLE